MKAPIEGTPLFQLTFESRGSYSDPQAWTRTCCDASSRDCAISSDGASYTLDGATSTVGTFIGPLGELLAEFRDLDAAEDVDVGFVAGGGGKAMCFLVMKGVRDPVDAGECGPEPADLAAKCSGVTEGTPPCLLHKKGGEVLVCAGSVDACDPAHAADAISAFGLK